MEEKIEALAANIYAQLVVAEFYQPNGLDYEQMEHKARGAAASFYKKSDGADGGASESGQ
jgi:hypothetical protein